MPGCHASAAGGSIQPNVSGPLGGHAILADGYGYQGGVIYHHLNMGWSGSMDLWYNLPNIEDSGFTLFNNIYKCVYNVYPDGDGEIISGRTLDGNGLPVDGVTVTADAGGTVYTANGWQELGTTDGFGRVRRDFYVQHHKPKRLFGRELCRHARRSLQADQLKPALAGVEATTRPRSPHRPAQIRSLVEHLKTLPDYRKRIGIYPLWSLLAMGVLAHLCGAPRGPKEWALFAKGLSQVQRRALGVRPQSDGYPAPGPTTFWRLLAQMDADALEKVFLQVQEQIRGPAPPDELIVLDGKQPRPGGGHSVLTAVPVPSQHYLGSALVDQKTNEIPVARELFKNLELDGRKVSLDALHTQDQTARELVLEHGADFLLTVKDNQPTLRQNIEKLVAAPPADFSPSGGHHHAGGPA